ncbi:unnamed protein product [Allacma fusca]|uniref:AAA+ ATPase domain-containing protein n=1 Tax=Allacma fusca TaxID=39272 RepID=A0A8J2Q1U2_9HEXA|nr:unnamed protein product [Allacma fusca]
MSCIEYGPPKQPQQDEDIDFRLPAVPSLGKFANDKWGGHPLLSYYGHVIKRRFDDQVIIRRGKRQKAIICDKIYREKLAKGELCAVPIDPNDNLDSFLTQDDFVEYLRDSVRSAPVDPLQASWKKRILAQIPKKLKSKLPDLYEFLVKDMEERYEHKMHEAVQTYVIRPTMDEDAWTGISMKMPFFMREPPWVKEFKENKEAILLDLRLLHPLIWKTFLKVREMVALKGLIDWEEIKKIEVAKPHELKEILQTQIKENGDEIMNKYIPLLTHLYSNLRGLHFLSKEKAVPLLDCAANVITSNCLHLIREAIIEVVQAYVNYEDMLPFILLDSTIEENTRVSYYPAYQDIMFCIKKIFDEISAVVTHVPDVREYYNGTNAEEDGPTSNFKVHMLPEFLDEAMLTISNVVEEWLREPDEFIAGIQKTFQPLLGGEARAKAENFVSEGYSFQEGIHALDYYKDFITLCREIPKNVFFGRVRVNNEDIIAELLDLANLHVHIILDSLIEMYRQHNRDVIDGFLEISNKLLTEPVTTAELMELVEYIDDARGRLVSQLKEKIAEGNKMYFALLEFHIFSAPDLELSVTAQTWARRIQPAFEKSAIMIEDKKVEFEENLAAKIEKMNADLKKLLRRVRDDFARYGDYEKCAEYCDDLKYVHKRVHALEKGIEWINNEETLFKFSLSQFPDMEEIKNQLDPYTRLFTVASKWQKLEKKYMDGDFKLDVEAIDTETEELFKELYKLQKLFKNRIKAQMQAEAEAKHIPVSLLWDEDNLEQVPPPLKICNKALDSLSEFRDNLPFIGIMCNPGLKKRHWDQMSEICGFDVTPDTGTSLRKLLQMDLSQYMDKFEGVSLAASKEHALEQSIDKMQTEWDNTKLNTIDYKDTGIKILASVEEIQLLLDDHITKTQTMKGSPFVKPHEAKIKAWEESLLRSQETLEEWLKVQSQWLYLEPVFSSEDIMQQMPEEGRLFKKVDATWRQIMTSMGESANVVETASQPGLLEKFQECVSLLDRINKGLNAYLEKKRLFFPRFFFLSNDEMLEILSETKDPLRVQPHLKKCFEGISKLHFDSDLVIHGMYSAEGERVYFSQPVDTVEAHGCVEKWLLQVEEVMIMSVRDVIANSRDAYAHSPRSEWVIKWPGMVVLCVSQIFWTMEVHEAIGGASGGLSQYLERLNTQLNDIVALVRGNLTKQSRITLGALVTIDVHARDVVDEMKDTVKSETDFKWLAQLRYYFEDYNVLVRITNATVKFAYEYLGNSPRLVITPLTDRCYRTLIGAYHLHLNGAPEGPAGTGKTETTKDLAKALAVQCVVFNCSDGLDYIAMGKFFKGLAACGAWACFDEFNRIELELSSQFHYDYGMRAVKSVLLAAANLKLKFPTDNEDFLLLRSIMDVNLPKFLSHDIPLFEGIISDIFPGVKLPEADYKNLYSAIDKSCRERNLQAVDVFKTKTIQMYEMMIVRHGFMLVGDPFGGKTSVIRVLADSLTHMESLDLPENKVLYEVINPKAITMGQLYGNFDPASHEWSDGVIATVFRTFANTDTEDRKWVIFDGPVDAVWIENMNTVLDDNKKLCLMSGEIIAMTAPMSMVFEVMDLSQASPATVSRCGMIYFEPVALGWDPLLRSWIYGEMNKAWHADNTDKFIHDMSTFFLTHTLKFVQKNCKELVKTNDSNLTKAYMNLVDTQIKDVVKDLEKEQKYLRTWLTGAILFAIPWAVGGILDYDSRVKFDQFMRLLISGKDASFPFFESMPQKLETVYPAEGSVFDFFFEAKGRGSWRHWNELVRGFEMPQHNQIRRIIVPTVDTARYTYLMDLCIRYQLPLLIIGPTGTGKSAYVQEKIMNGIPQEQYLANLITFSAQTTASSTQDLVISRLDKKGRGYFGPPAGKKCIIFVDDMNMPSTEVYGAQPPIELLRQYFDHKHWYDKKDTSKIFLQDIQFLAVMGPPGGSRQNITPRFLRHFNVVSINTFSDETMVKIFQTLMQIYLRNSGFSPEYFGVVHPIVASTMEVYKEAINNLLPTPAKSHYTFNLRDFSRVIQGCCLIQKNSVDSKRIFVRLWIHEVYRVFYDRLTDDSDRNWLFQLSQTCVQNHFKESFDVIFENLSSGGPKSKVKEADMNNLMFGDFMNPDLDKEERVYAEIKDIDQFYKVVLLAMNEYNNVNKNRMDLVIFRYLLEHLVHICRILRIPGGHGLLVGVGGSGRQSLTKLASFMGGHQLFQPEISKNYGRNEWREDLKKGMKNAGGYGRDTVLVITDSQIKEEGFLEDVDSLLNSGDVPNIFNAEEKGEISEAVMPAWLAQMTQEKKRAAGEINPLVLFAFYVGRVKEKLHIIIAFSPIGSAFRIRIRQYTSLVNCCTIDWFQPWPEDALERVAQKSLEELNIPADLKKGSVKICKFFHTRAATLADDFWNALGRHVYVTPTSYLELILTFKQVIQGKKEDTMNAKLRYLGGLDRLAFASGEIAVMKKELTALMPQLNEASKITQGFITRIEKESAEVEKKSILVKDDEARAHIQAEEASKLKSECLEDLAEALPVLEKALKALDTLKPSDIILVKSMKNPPPAVKLVMAAVCVMKQIKPDKIKDADGKTVMDFWGPSKRLLGEFTFLEDLKNYPKDDIPASVMADIRSNFINQSLFNVSTVSKASSAAAGLCRWIVAMEQYDKVAKVVAPKKARLTSAENTLKETLALLNAKRAEIQELEEKLATLKEEFEETNAKKAKLEAEVNLCVKKLERAEKLIGGLGGEKHRWEEEARILQNIHNNLGADVLIASAVISYLGPYTANYRNECINDWVNFVLNMGISCSKHFSLSKTLGSPIKIQAWNIGGLPNDAFSVDNAVMVDLARRFPLMIDPQGQANKWIKNCEKENKLRITKLSDPDFMRKLEYCIGTGTPMLVENVSEELDPALGPILEKKTFKQSGVDMIRLGDVVVEFNPLFRFYITTKLRNPHYLPEVSTKVLLLNFMITLEGLEDQLLGIVVAKERPELEEERQQLIIQTAANTRSLKEVEDNILNTLSSSEGNILENETAINILDSSKQISNDISEKQSVAVETEKQIEKSRLGYRPIARYTSVLFFSLTELPNIDPMYQYSLTWFVNLFIGSIEHSNRSKVLEKRLRNLTDHFTWSLYAGVCRSLFEKDKLLFSFVLCVSILTSQAKLSSEEFQFLLTGGVGLENTIPNPAPEWLLPQSWDELCRMVDANSIFKKFLPDFQNNLSKWKGIAEHKDPHLQLLPSPWHERLSDFQKMIVIRCLRPDKLVPMIISFVSNNMGDKFVQPPPFDLTKSYADSTHFIPLVFILSPGADPMSNLLKFADDSGFGGSKFEAISLGQGQGPIAQEMITKAVEEGSWVALQNCHLAASWMPTLEKICEELPNGKVAPTFRLWLTSYPSPKFPVTILQNSVKMTNEPPTGLRQNLLQSYASDPISDSVFYDSVMNKEKAFHRLLFGLCFFHAVIQERRKFGPLGWNIPYEFNESDLKISLQQLQMFLQESLLIPFEALSYLTGECNYGGRVTDDKDRRLLMSILSVFYCPEIVDRDKYSLSSSGVYYVPKDTSYDSCVMHIKKMPSNPSPEVFGLHENANITKSNQETQQLLAGALLTQSEKGAGDVGAEAGAKVIDVAHDILGKLPKEYDMDIVMEKYPVDYMNSMNTVLRQELIRFNPLIRIVRSSLANVQKAIKGQVVMTPDLDEVFKNMLIGKVPGVWASKSYPSLKPLGGYILDLLGRLKFLQDWIDDGEPPVFWLSGFYFTQSFLTGVSQNFARKYKIPIDLLGFEFQVTSYEKQTTSQPNDGAYCSGLFLEGARWSRENKMLAESKPKVLFDTIPVIWFKPGIKAEFREYTCYDSPVYKTTARRGTLSTTGHSTNFVLYLKLPTNLPAKHWINRGTACLCQLDD